MHRATRPGHHRSFIRGQCEIKVVNQGSASRTHFASNVYADIRHDAIEIPWNTLGFIHGEDSQQQTWTVTLHRPRNLPSFNVRPGSLDEDVADVARNIMELFLQTSLPFYARFSDIAMAETLANTRPLGDLTPYSVGGPLEHRAMRSLLLAKVANPARYEQVRHRFITSEIKTMFPREKCLEILGRVDSLDLGTQTPLV